MTFSSLTWFAIMVGSISLYWILPARLRDYFFVLASLSFLLAVDLVSGSLLIGFTLISYAVANRGTLTVSKIALAVLAVIGVLAYYKVTVSNSPFDVIRDVAMPIGLSYYSFRVVHYLIESYRRSLPDHDFSDYVCYLFFLPTLLVGPIHRFREFVLGRGTKTWKADDLSEGMERILIGYFKIIVLGNFLFSKYFALQVGALGDSWKSLALYLEAVRGSLNLYVQFSGYSDIAIGFALMLGYRVMENFNWPFFKKNIAEFWRAWHISLTSWSRDYVYMTAVGFTRKPWFGTLTSLIVIGIWHELSLRYVVWGLYHGAGIVGVNQLQKFLRRRKVKPLHGPVLTTVLDGVKILATANYFFFGYIIINQESLYNTVLVYRAILFDWWL